MFKCIFRISVLMSALETKRKIFHSVDIYMTQKDIYSCWKHIISAVDHHCRKSSKQCSRPNQLQYPQSCFLSHGQKLERLLTVCNAQISKAAPQQSKHSQSAEYCSISDRTWTIFNSHKLNVKSHSCHVGGNNHQQDSSTTFDIQ